MMGRYRTSCCTSISLKFSRMVFLFQGEGSKLIEGNCHAMYLSVEGEIINVMSIRTKPKIKSNLNTEFLLALNYVKSTGCGRQDSCSRR
jgi:hypothetical protein